MCLLVDPISPLITVTERCSCHVAGDWGGLVLFKCHVFHHGSVFCAVLE